MAEMSIRDRFIKWLREQVGCIYVWGGQGETDISEAWIRRMEDSEEHAKRAISFWQKRVKEGKSYIAAFDCSGLITEFLLKNGIIRSDITSRGLYAVCDEISKKELIPGDFVFRHNGENIYHVGVYIGDGKVIHARGRDYGVVEERIDANGESYWNRFARMSAITGDVLRTGHEYPKAMEYVGATYVNLRSAPTSEGSDNVIGRVSRGDVVLVLADAGDSWKEAIVRTSGGFMRGYCIGSWLSPVSGERF